MSDGEFTIGLQNYLDANPQFSPSAGASMQEISQALSRAACNYTKTIPREQWPTTLKEDYGRQGGAICSAFGITF